MRTLLILTLLISPVYAQDWTRFRGPNSTGLSDAKGLPRQWAEKKNVVWKTALPHKGWSSPVILGNQVWVTSAPDDGKQQFALCLDRETGKIVHEIKVFDTPKVPYTTRLDYNSHASPSPVIEKGRVYVHFGSTGTASLDTESGKILWQRRDLECDHFRGPGSSPILWNDFLILTFDGYDKQYTVALHKDTGKTAWLTPRNIKYKSNDGDHKKAYCTPVVIDVAGKPQLVSPAADATVAYDPATGKEIWKVYHGGMNAATPPQYAHGLVYVTIGAGSTLLAIKPTGTGDVTDTHVAWKYTKEAPSRPAPLIVGDMLLMVNDKGFAIALDARTGKEKWRQRITGNYYSSPIFVDDHLYIFDRAGKGYVLSVAGEGKVVAMNKLDDAINATPAVAGKALFVRGDKFLYRIEDK